MNLPLLFARRYLLAKRSTNAVNVITAISMVVIAVVAAAMVVVLSTMNGIAELVESIYSPFDQDITITPTEGKTFERSALDQAALFARPEVVQGSWTIEENVLLRCGDQQTVATLKGVEPQYLAMSRMDEFIYTGTSALQGNTGAKAILGIALKSDLDVPLDDGILEPLEISAPVRGRKLSRYQQGAFEHASIAVSGAYSMNMEFDAKYALVPLDMAAELLHYDSAVSALELQLAPGSDLDRTAGELRTLLGADFRVRTRHQKNELMYRTNASEKFFTFIVLAFIGLIGAFNIIASLTMMMIEKRRDMRTVIAMGATPAMVRNVFLYEGLLIVLVGTVAGVLLGLAVCVAQQRFGFVELTGSVVEAYPVKVFASDLILVFATVSAIGLMAAWVPLRSLSKRFLHATAASA
jgi:ABC-type lipoprotein release transport system permease subunit